MNVLVELNFKVHRGIGSEEGIVEPLTVVKNFNSFKDGQPTGRRGFEPQLPLVQALRVTARFGDDLLCGLAADHPALDSRTLKAAAYCLYLRIGERCFRYGSCVFATAHTITHLLSTQSRQSQNKT
jgi:hypothetical protein